MSCLIRITTEIKICLKLVYAHPLSPRLSGGQTTPPPWSFAKRVEKPIGSVLNSDA